jgi:hypothetical protein
MARILIVGDNLSGEGMWQFFKDHHEVSTLNIWAAEKEEPTWFNYVMICETALTKNCGLTKKPKIEDFRCDTVLIEDAMRCCHAGLFIIASPVEPGTTDRLKALTGQRIVHIACEPGGFLFGGSPEDTKEAVELFASIAEDEYRYLQTDAKTCEMFKYSKAVFESVQHELMQKIKDVSILGGVDFNQLREAWIVLNDLDLTKVASTPTNKSIAKNFIAYASAIGCEIDVLKINV